MYERYGGTFGSTYLQHSAHRAKQGKAANGQRQWTVKNQSTTFLFLFLCHIVLQRKQDGNNILCFFLGRLPLIGIEDTLTRIGDNRGMSVKKRNHFRSMLFTRSPCLVWQNRIDAPIWQLQNGRPLRTGGCESPLYTIYYLLTFLLQVYWKIMGTVLKSVTMSGV